MPHTCSHQLLQNQDMCAATTKDTKWAKVTFLKKAFLSFKRNFRGQNETLIHI